MKVVVLTDVEHKHLSDMCKQACDTLSPTALHTDGTPLPEKWASVLEKVAEAK